MIFIFPLQEIVLNSMEKLERNPNGDVYTLTAANIVSIDSEPLTVSEYMHAFYGTVRPYLYVILTF